ncbi:MAG: sigma factor-like helix-turn-helix DNA-binding protein [Mycobacteriaceae bacterium]
MSSVPYGQLVLVLVSESTAAAVEDIIRTQGRQVLAALIRVTGSIIVAEDAVLQTLERWPTSGIPLNPRAWLIVVARNKAMDTIRRESSRGTKELQSMEQVGWEEDPVDSVIRDDLLPLIFTCCHPALSIEAQVALSLRTLCGLSVADTARLLLVSEVAMARRLCPGKAKDLTSENWIAHPHGN